MKTQHPHYRIDALCRLFGNSRQTYYEKENYSTRQHLKEDMILSLVRSVRRDFPRMGAKKLLVYLKPCFEQMNIEVDRDAFIDLLGCNQMLVKRTRNTCKTTFSIHWIRKYLNLIRGFTPSYPNMLWVSDITYIEAKGGFLYLSLIADACSRKIVG